MIQPRKFLNEIHLQECISKWVVCVAIVERFLKIVPYLSFLWRWPLVLSTVNYFRNYASPVYENNPTVENVPNGVADSRLTGEIPESREGELHGDVNGLRLRFLSHYVQQFVHVARLRSEPRRLVRRYLYARNGMEVTDRAGKRLKYGTPLISTASL